MAVVVIIGMTIMMIMEARADGQQWSCEGYI